MFRGDKGKMLVASIFSVSHNIFYSSMEVSFYDLCYIWFVCPHIKGLGAYCITIVCLSVHKP